MSEFRIGGDAVARQSCPTVLSDCSREDRAPRACSESPRIAHYPSFGFFMLIVPLYAVYDSRCRRQQLSRYARGRSKQHRWKKEQLEFEKTRLGGGAKTERRSDRLRKGDSMNIED